VLKAVAEAKSNVTVSPARYLGCRGQRDHLPRPTVLVGVFFFGSTSVSVMGASCSILFWDIVPKR